MSVSRPSKARRRVLLALLVLLDGALVLGSLEATRVAGRRLSEELSAAVVDPTDEARVRVERHRAMLRSLRTRIRTGASVNLRALAAAAAPTSGATVGAR